MQIKHITVCVSIVIFLIPMAAASQPGSEDVIYLRDGSILRGEIIEQTDTEAIKIKTVGRNVFVVRAEDIREITREKLPETRLYKNSGYVNQTGFILLPGNDNTPVRFQMVNGYQFTPHFSVGLGIGFIAYNDPLNHVPVFIDLRYKLLAANVTPFLFFRSGHSFSILPDDDPTIEGHRGGFMLNPGVGIHFDVSPGFGFYLSGGYNMDKSEYQQDGGAGRTISNEIRHRRLQLGFGLAF